MLMSSCDDSPPLRVLLVDDHELTRLSLKLTFSNLPDMLVVGSARNGQEAVEMVKFSRPDVVVLDLHMPVMDGWRASGYIKAISPNTQILAYSSSEDAHLQQTKSMTSFDDVCNKDAPTNQLVSLVKRLGQRAINNSFAG
jgi:DNA-binding NarL/FixJ family response regulator